MAKSKAKIKAKVAKSKGKVNKSIKTKKAAAKRYKLTASGLVKVPHCGKQHKAASKNRSRKTRLKKAKIMRAESVRLVSRCLPNGL
ncbi:MAG: bL35 family ribosomal protein [Bdellovibrionota bacterium]